MTDERDPMADVDAIIDGTPTIEETAVDGLARGAVRTETVGARPPGARRGRPHPIRAF